MQTYRNESLVLCTESRHDQ